ncbi:MAG: hypothetical protein CVV64_16435 [Candidatus Wallbacteria bacterium HGW-Wallbacteria-1]|jgi:hypothetical protein|uniref:phosphodiesterase I n=1 Tax=Candidatus Wallbacteria bacterium HGW-Wallbacteria-1 TaxID=2013854 RepID=A0A2N1PKT1_9BACT|nr:MAG: hypothetical protein CVV64_16435 [Candidatus Wallbacteria bacterium HGW-Wallbacteria-1]
MEEDYYLQNFISMLDHVTGIYGDILDPHHMAFGSDFRELSPGAARLWVRAITRKGPALRIDRLNYSEIPCRDEAIAELCERGFAQLCGSVEARQALKTILKDEVTLIFSDILEQLAIPSRAGKSEMITALLDSDSRYDLIVERIAAHSPWLTLLRLDSLLILRLCYFGNLWQDLSEFVISDMGILKFEKVSFRKEDRYFQTSGDLNATMSLLLIADEIYLNLSAAEPEQINEWAERTFRCLEIGSGSEVRRRHDRIINSLARQLERIGDDLSLRKALELYSRAIAPPSRERRARIFLKAAEADAKTESAKTESARAAETLISEILDAPRDQDEYEFALRRRKSLPRFIPLVHQYILEPSAAVCVEELAAETLRQSVTGSKVWSVENSLMCGLLGLAFWDIIFAPHPGAFCNPYQRGPVDLFRPSFREARKSEISSRLDEILCRSGDTGEYLLEVRQQKSGTANFLVNWSLLTPELISAVLKTLGTENLVRIFDLMLFDLRSNCSGFPDLFMTFPVEDGAAGQPFSSYGYEFIEVKGPGDRLQANQIRWFRRFTEWGIPCSVMKIIYADECEAAD